MSKDKMNSLSIILAMTSILLALYASGISTEKVAQKRASMRR